MAGYGNDGESGFEGCVVGRAVGTYLHGPLLPRNPELADTLLSWAIAHATGTEPERLSSLPDELERAAQAVSAGRAQRSGWPTRPLAEEGRMGARPRGRFLRAESSDRMPPVPLAPARC